MARPGGPARDAPQRSRGALRVDYGTGRLRGRRVRWPAVSSPGRRLRSPLGQEPASAVARSCPGLVALRTSRAAAWHAVEHKSIAAYEAGGPARSPAQTRYPKEHPRCGSNLIVPMIAAIVATNLLLRCVPGHAPPGDAPSRARSRRHRRRALRLRHPALRATRLARASTRSVTRSRHGGHPRARGGRAAVGVAALQEICRVEASSPTPAAAGSRIAYGSRVCTCRFRQPHEPDEQRAQRRAAPARARDLRPAGRQDARRLLLRRVLHVLTRGPRLRRAPPAGPDAGVPARPLGARRDRRGAGDPAAVRRTRGRRRWVSAWDELRVRALFDGDLIEPWEPVLEIEGDYSLFCHLETLYLGVLAGGP